MAVVALQFVALLAKGMTPIPRQRTQPALVDGDPHSTVSAVHFSPWQRAIQKQQLLGALAMNWVVT